MYRCKAASGGAHMVAGGDVGHAHICPGYRPSHLLSACAHALAVLVLVSPALPRSHCHCSPSDVWCRYASAVSRAATLSSVLQGADRLASTARISFTFLKKKGPPLFHLGGFTLFLFTLLLWGILKPWMDREPCVSFLLL